MNAPAASDTAKYGESDRHHVRRHVRMDVAEDPAQAGVIEDDVPQRSDGIQPEIEPLAVAEREDVVEHPIAVREIDDCSDPYGKHVGREREVALIEHDLRALDGFRNIRRVEPDHRIGDWLTAGARTSVHIRRCRG